MIKIVVEKLKLNSDNFVAIFKFGPKINSSY